jgi:hypothetical protein
MIGEYAINMDKRWVTPENTVAETVRHKGGSPSKNFAIFKGEPPLQLLFEIASVKGRPTQLTLILLIVYYRR